MEFLKFKNIQIRYKCAGSKENPAVVLLHGYLEALEIWETFVPLLSNNYFVVCVDIPGHGQSGNLGEKQSMDDMAAVVHSVSSHLGLDNINIVGHSMGGYVALAFRKAFQSELASLCLFHSTCFADTEEKKENRDREIDLVRKGKRDFIVNKNIPMAFADENLHRLEAIIEKAKFIASRTDESGIIAVLNAMKERPDYSELLKDDSLPVLLIAGELDNYIPSEAVYKMKQLGTNFERILLDKSGHMGFMEQPEESALILTSFFKKVASL